jgi:hypothetical protein
MEQIFRLVRRSRDETIEQELGRFASIEDAAQAPPPSDQPDGVLRIEPIPIELPNRRKPKD